MDIIVAIHVTKLLTKNFSLSAYGVRYFLGQHMWPFKLYQFFDEINQSICSSKGKKTLSLSLDNC